MIKLSFFLLSLLGANNVLRLSFCLTHISSHNNKYYYFDYNKGLLLVKPLYLLRSNLSVTNRDVPKIQFVKIIPDSTPTNPKYKKMAYHYNSGINKSSGENEGEERSPGKRDTRKSKGMAFLIIHQRKKENTLEKSYVG